MNCQIPHWACLHLILTNGPVNWIFGHILLHKETDTSDRLCHMPKVT